MSTQLRQFTWDESGEALYRSKRSAPVFGYVVPAEYKVPALSKQLITGPESAFAGILRIQSETVHSVADDQIEISLLKAAACVFERAGQMAARAEFARPGLHVDGPKIL